MSTRTTSAVTGPGVLLVQACGWPMMGITPGSTICAWKRSSDQPAPNGKRSSRTLATPHSRNCSIAQRPASSIAGDPVRRGP